MVKELNFCHAPIRQNGRWDRLRGYFVISKITLMLFLLYLILEEKWHKSRANIYESLIVQFNGWKKLEKNWLYFNPQNGDISTMPVFSKR
jgi:hypothetical protein